MCVYVRLEREAVEGLYPVGASPVCPASEASALGMLAIRLPVRGHPVADSYNNSMWEGARAR